MYLAPRIRNLSWWPRIGPIHAYFFYRGGRGVARSTHSHVIVVAVEWPDPAFSFVSLWSRNDQTHCIIIFILAAAAWPELCIPSLYCIGRGAARSTHSHCILLVAEWPDPLISICIVVTVEWPDPDIFYFKLVSMAPPPITRKNGAPSKKTP